MADDFNGAKVALFTGDRLIVSLRDDKPGILYPNHWDFPGGGREGDETPFETVAREVHEELGLILPASAILWQRAYPASFDQCYKVWFFVAQIPAGAERDVVFGNEGQRWALMTTAEFAALPNAIPAYVQRLSDWQASIEIN